MKKKYILISCLILVFLTLPCISAGFLDDFFGDNTNNVNFTDIGTSENSSSDWFILKNVVKTVTENGTYISSNGDSGIYANKPGSSSGWNESFDWSTPFTIEFDILNWNGTASIRIINSNADASHTFKELGIKNGSHVKIVSNDNDITYYVDGKQVDSLNSKFTDAQIGLRLVNSTVFYKNFKIY